MNVLLLAPETPFPPHGGGKIDVFTKFVTLKKLGFNIFVIYSFSNPKEDSQFKKIAKNFINGIYSYPRKKNFKFCLSLSSYFILSNKPNKLEKKEIDSFLSNKDFQHIIVDSLFSFKLGEYIERKYPRARIVHRMHNLESEYLLSFASSLKFLQAKKWFFMFEGLKILLKEKSYYKKYKNIAAISIAEKNLLKRHFPQKNIFWIPPFYDTICINNESQSEKSIKELITKVKRKKVFLLTGTFGSGFNVKQTKWFINKVFKPLLKKNHNYLFIVAGLGSNQFFKTEDNIHVIPRYDSVAPLMKIADLVIILANGRCGVKLKLVEALSFRKKIVSSKDGVFGSGLENLIPNTDDEKEFSNYCIDALNNKINYSKAFDFFQENFDCLKNMKRLMGIKD